MGKGLIKMGAPLNTATSHVLPHLLKIQSLMLETLKLSQNETKNFITTCQQLKFIILQGVSKLLIRILRNINTLQNKQFVYRKPMLQSTYSVKMFSHLKLNRIYEHKFALCEMIWHYRER